MDASRKLRMCSDFPHLIKWLRNNLMKKKKFKVPEGWVLFSHFEKLFELESNKEFKMAFKLTASHIYPKHGEKMNTRLPFQLYSNTTAVAMETYRDKNILSNIDSTIIYCKKINRPIDIMNSSKSDNGLKLDSQEYEDLDSFLIYLDLWKQCSPTEFFYQILLMKDFAQLFHVH
ncbi:uncharacterized protein [Leptinotarsa decemlineata]|uniref:uncharacterized protein n=1 Tax=Leptinotarsa decemlineata TaxID=7539 RepID=UPI003D30C789